MPIIGIAITIVGTTEQLEVGYVPPAGEGILLEQGGNLLKEDGDKIILEG